MATYWLTRFAILRLLGLVYLVAFLVAAHQNPGLIGSDGLTPVGPFLHSVQASPWQLPTLFWLNSSDAALSTVAWSGVVLSALVLLGFANAVVMAILWALYMSIVHVGQDWYSFGWEIQLLETGFLSIFLCPLLDLRPFPRTPPQLPVIWLFRWLGFRIMIGSGLIKLRNDACWHNLTCLDHFFETQPIPNPVSRVLQFLPPPVLHFGVLWNHFVELVCPWFSFGPRLARHLAGLIMISFQVFLIIGGNLAFLNWLTIVPFLACLDDSLWQRVMPKRLVEMADRAAEQAVESKPVRASAWLVTALVAVLSIGPVENLISPQQAMNRSFEPFELVNTYGAFGTVGQTRDEIIFEGSSDGQNWIP
ncbi:MAG: lipase maturation factor family protein, partial [Candidatus Xenobia bacterium]